MNEMCYSTDAHIVIVNSTNAVVAVEKECERTQEEILAEAAESLAALYESDGELTAFTTLDGEDFA
jgi:hypothetical protein